ncbi:XRE family transcriptional regulator [Ktedonosporobacter rubrisoli]|uniref:XRE family transcriptional regulator n=1 Tax=Ktedonosporobacter rubrisoli TaxID=2509675 RepID=A0A4P6JVV5_KTERU|nr:helix-turn-helix domain-containing protein [Ktedonosporobacter rubrisoli]QBD79808.1 XRE family transcriptional regulator [Ktedonosporobacter rubrisoli]
MNIDDITDFSRLVAYFRQRRGLSQGQLAQATRLSRTYVYHLETGQRMNPSPHVVRNIALALDLSTEEREQLYRAYTALTGQFVSEPLESTLLDLGELARLLVHNTLYPAHSLTKLWYFHSWNEAVSILFDIREEITSREQLHLLELVFDPALRSRFHGWENLARRLVTDFQYDTRTITHLPEYKTLIKQLRELPDFRRIAAATYPKKPSPSFTFQIQHRKLGHLTLRTATTIFTGISAYSMVSYVPGDQQTLSIYREYGWQRQPRP